VATLESGRVVSYGQGEALSPIDRLGVWLSDRRIRTELGSLSGMRVGDFGCGYQAAFIRSVLHSLRDAVVIDVSLSPTLHDLPRLTPIEGVLPEAAEKVEDESLDVVLCISVLEHLWHPERTMAEIHRILVPGGVCIVNVPTWRGKWFLELSAFKLGLSPAAEMDDHKTYYDPSDLWPVLVRGGFLPHNIRCSKHKFGINTVATCRRDLSSS
jgi:SAM-dependent methyltransferase